LLQHYFLDDGHGSLDDIRAAIWARRTSFLPFSTPE
jgi:hypothetical protein